MEKTMKTALKIAAGAFAVSSLASMAHAQNVATGTATGSVNIVRPITITNTAGLQFGKLAQPAGAATVTVSPGGTVSLSGVGTVGTQTTSAAGFNVGGDGAAVFAINVPSGTFNMLAGTSGTILVSTSLSAATGTLSGSTGSAGSTSFTVGGIMTLGAAQALGAYSGTFNVTVTYN